MLGIYQTNPLFGSCDTASFTDLLERFEAECEKVGGVNEAVLAPPVVPKPFGGGYGYNRGTGASTPTATKVKPAAKKASTGAKRSYSSYSSSSYGRGGYGGYGGYGGKKGRYY